LSEKILDVLMQHSFVDPFGSFIRCIDDRRQHFLAGAACDHVISRRIGGRLLDFDVRGLAWKYDRVGRSITQSFVSLIEEEYLTLINSLNLASNLRYLLTHFG